MTDLQVVCWDFGDTLVDERWMQLEPDGYPEWGAAYRAVIADNPHLVDAWNVGEATVDDIVTKVAEATTLTHEAVIRHFHSSCRNLTFFEQANAALHDWRPLVPQVCVTVNPDLFSQVVVPEYGLTERFDTVVTSWEERATSKVALTQVALERLDLDVDLDRCLLIDNRADNCREFREAGGQTYLFRSDAEFGPDRARGRFPSPLR